MMSSSSSSSDPFSSESNAENRLTRTSKKCKLDSTDNIRWVRSSNMPSQHAQSSSRSPSPTSSKTA